MSNMLSLGTIGTLNSRAGVRGRLTSGLGVAMVLVGILCVLTEPCRADKLCAIDLLNQSPERCEQALISAAATYRGESPDELLMFLDGILEASPTGPAAEGQSLDVTDIGWTECLDRVLDLLCEWPSDVLAKEVGLLMAATTPGKRRCGLMAARAVAENESIRNALIRRLVEKTEEPEELVLALLALGESRTAGVEADLARFLSDSRPAVREAAARASQSLLAGLGKKTLPLPDGKAAVPVAATIGGDLFADYPSLPRQDPGAAGLRFLAITLNARSQQAFDAPLLAAMTQVLQEGGTVIVVNPSGSGWPAALTKWATTSGTPLPSGERDAYGAGVVRYADYRSFADFPFELRDQPGRPAETAWSHWAASQAAPILAANRAGAFVVVQENVMGKGRIVFTTIDLLTRPIYRENLLRWVYGDALLAYAGQQKDYDFQPTGQTEHRAWMKPLAGTKPKMLYLSSSLFKRGLLETLERLDADWRYVPYDASFAAPPRKNDARQPPSRMGQRAVCLLEEALPWTEVLVFDTGSQNLLKSLTQEIKGSVSLDTVPARLRRAIYRRIHTEGMGLVGISNVRAPESCIVDFVARASGRPEDADSLGRFVEPLSPFPRPPQTETLPAPVPKVAVTGRGRMVWFNQELPHIGESDIIASLKLPDACAVPGLMQQQFPVHAEEYWYARLVKSIAWAAGVAPAVQIEKVDVASDGPAASTRVTVALSGAFTGLAECAVRDAWNRVQTTNRVPVGGAAATLEVGPLPTGWYVLETWLKTGEGKVVDCGAVKVTVPGAVTITEVAPDLRFYSTNATARLKVRLSAPFSGDLRVEVLDTYGRKTYFAEKTVGPPAAAIDMDIPIRNPLSRMCYVYLSLVKDGTILHRWRQPLGIVLPPRDLEFDLTASIARKSLFPFFKERMGVTVGFGDPDTHFANNLELSSGSWSDTIGVDPTPGVRINPRERDPCLSSSAFRLRAIKDLRKKGPLLRDLGITDFMISDECPLGGRCFAPDTLFRFRSELRRTYGSLEALNREWACAFTNWTDVLPCQGNDPVHPASYVDFDEFTHWIFAEYCNYLEVLASENPPGFMAGHSGGISDNIMMSLAGALYYYGVQEPAVSVKRPHTVIGSWYGPGYRFVENHETSCRHWPWWHLFRGTTRIQVWYPESGPPAYHEDLSRPYNAFVWLKEEMDDIHRGMGKLILHSVRDQGPVALYNSQRSQLVIEALKELTAAPAGVAKEEDQETMRRAFATLYPATRGDLQRAFLNEQVECRFLSEQLVESGEIGNRKLRLLVLPGVVSLSEPERTFLRSFVASGGVLVADMNTGLRNEHGTWVGSSFAEAMFGVQFDEGLEAFPAKAGAGTNVVLRFTGGQDAFPFTHLRGLASVTATARGRQVRLAGGTALATIGGDIPAIIVKPHAGGKCVFLSFAVAGDSPAAGALVRDLLSLAKITPSVSVSTNGSPVVAMDFGLFHNADNLHAGFVIPGKGGMVADEPRYPVVIRFPARGHLYDSRQGKYLGETNSIQAELVPGLAHVYSQLSCKMEALVPKTDKTAYRPGDVIQLESAAKASGPVRGQQVWHLTVLRPDQSEEAAYARNWLVSDGFGRLGLPVALNALPGTWALRLRDAATGVEGQITVQVGERP